MYAPLTFHTLRQLCGISADLFLVRTLALRVFAQAFLTRAQDSLCRLRKMPSEGKSRCGFFAAEDGRFIIKTLKREEAAVLRDLLAPYLLHLTRYPRSLLAR